MALRVFRLLKLLRARRTAANTISAPPTTLRVGELAVGESEGALYYGKSDGTVITLNSGDGSLGNSLITEGTGPGSLVGLAAQNNVASGARSTVFGGEDNDTNNYFNAHIVGSAITADNNNALFVNNLKVMGIPDGEDGRTDGVIALRNGTQIAVGSFDNMTGGQNGIGLHCYVGYELNWQGGRLRNVYIGDTSGTPQSIFCDSPLEFAGPGEDNMQIDATGLTFPDGTTQTTAGGGASTGDITFSGVQIIGSGEDSGDGLNNGTIELVPDSTLYASDQYLVVDPTAPGHIHLRAGGTQDASNAELILGGERAHVRVVDNLHEVLVRSTSGGNQQTISLGGFRYNGGEAAAYGPIPTGSTFVYGDGVTYTVTNSRYDGESGLWAIDLTPMPETEPIGDFEFSIPFNEKNFTFRNDGHFQTPGGVQFGDNTVQTTAGVPLTGAVWGDATGYNATGAVSFGLPDNSQTTLTVSRYNGAGFGNAASSVVLSAVYDGTEDLSDAIITLSCGGGYNPTEGSLTISARGGITFGDGTTQITAGVKSYNPHGINAATFGKVDNIMKISAAEYDVLTPDADTLYIIVD